MDCPFCAILRGELPAEIVYETSDVIAFKDLNPQAEIHYLVVPKEHVQDAWEGTPSLWSSLLTACQAIAKSERFNGFRLEVNCGKAAGQTVPHLHVHLLSGNLSKGL